MAGILHHPLKPSVHQNVRENKKKTRPRCNVAEQQSDVTLTKCWGYTHAHTLTHKQPLSHSLSLSRSVCLSLSLSVCCWTSRADPPLCAHLQQPRELC